MKQCLICTVLLFLTLCIYSVPKANVDSDRCIYDLTYEVQQYYVHQTRERRHNIVVEFMERLAHLESSGRYNVVNGSYYGKYQFGYLAFADLGYTDINTSHFLNDPDLQNSMLIDWITVLDSRYLHTVIDEYSGTIVNDIYVTQFGILAAAHLGGSASVRRYFNSNGTIIFRDGNNTSIERYLKEFEDLDMYVPLSTIDTQLILQKING